MMNLLKIIITIFFVGFFYQADSQTDAIAKYFDQYIEDERFTSVYVSSKMFQMLARLSADDQDAAEVIEVISDLKGLRILTTETTPKTFADEFRSKVSSKEYEILFTAREQGNEIVEFLIKEDGDIITELLLFVDNPDEFVLLSFIGNIDLDKLSKLSESMDIDGLEYLDKMDQKMKKSSQ